VGSGILLLKSGGKEAEPAFGRLGSVESMAKPTAKVGFCILTEGGGNLVKTKVDTKDSGETDGAKPNPHKGGRK